MSGRLRSLRESTALRLAAVALSVFALALVCILFTREHGRVAAVWPGNALVLAVLLLTPTRAWPAYLGAAVAGLVAVNTAVGDTVANSVLLATLNGAEIAAAAALSRRVVGPSLDTTKPRQLVRFAAVAAVAPLVSTLGAAAILPGDPLQNGLRWYLSDGLGLLLVTPALVALAADWSSLRESFSHRRSVAPAIALAVALALVFGQERLPLLFLIFPPLLWCAFAMGAAGTALVLLVTTAVAVVATATGHGSTTFIPGTLQTKLAVLQVLLTTIVVVSLPLTAVLTERRRLTASLREALARTSESEARYRTLADNATDIIACFGPDAVFTFLSPSVKTVLGYEPDELIGRTTRTIMHPDDYKRSLVAYGEHIEMPGPEEAFHFEYRAFRKDGTMVWLSGHPRAIHDPQTGAFIGFQDVVRDITERKAADAALADSEARYRMLADHATDVVIKVDRDDVILYVSPSVARYGYAPEDLIGRSGYTIIHPHDLLKARELIAELFESDQVDPARDRTYRVQIADGSYIWMEGNPSLVRGPDGEVEAVISQLRDIGVRKGLEAELTAARDEAEAAASAKADFMANMSHEIRTPLTAILGFTSLLAGREDLAEDARYQVGRVGAAGQALLAIVNDILDFSKLEAGLMPITPKPVAPREALSEAMALFEPQVAAKGLTLDFAPTADLPAWVSFDPDRVRQILLNLIGNAVKFTEAGVVTVSVGYDAADERLRVAVKDSGAGMNDEQQAKLFRRFSQVDGSMAKGGGGTGLGLAICLGLVDAMGGDIGVTSAPGEGSTFAFEIPAPVCDAPMVAPGGLALSGLAGLRVLLADDNPLNRELTRSVLAPFEIEVTDVEDGQAAVEMARLLPYDVILLDVRMPVLDGPSAARVIRGEPGPNSTAPILAFSAENELDEESARLFDGHVRKPIDVALLLGALAQATAWEEALAYEPPASATEG